MKLSLNHIGIAVDNLPAMRKLFSLLGLEIDHVETVADQGVKAHFIELETPKQPPKQSNEQGYHLELLEVTDPGSAVAKFIEKRGPGIHHLSFLVETAHLKPLCQKLTQEGYRLTYPEPRQGAHQMLINFIHPASAGGILIELMEAMNP